MSKREEIEAMDYPICLSYMESTMSRVHKKDLVYRKRIIKWMSIRALNLFNFIKEDQVVLPKNKRKDTPNLHSFLFFILEIFILFKESN